MTTKLKQWECLVFEAERFLRSSQIWNQFNKHKTDVDRFIQNHQERNSFQRWKNGSTSSSQLQEHIFILGWIIIERKWQCQCSKNLEGMTDPGEKRNGYPIKIISNVDTSGLCFKRLPKIQAFMTLGIVNRFKKANQWMVNTKIHLLYAIIEQVRK